MGVYIKGMDKETAVRICAYAGLRMEDSDFIPVPPHGRLIDADELDKMWGLIGHDDLAKAPTIIPAEPCKEKGE